MPAFIRIQYGLDRLEAWLDPESDLTLELGAGSLPTTILYDSQGNEVWRYLGDNDWTSEQASALLDESASAGGI